MESAARPRGLEGAFLAGSGFRSPGPSSPRLFPRGGSWRARHSAPRALQDGDYSLGGILSTAADLQKPGRPSGRRSSAHTDDARLRGARDAEATSALCLRYWHWAGGRKYRYGAVAYRAAGALSAGNSAPGEP